MNDAFYESLAVWSQVAGSIAFLSVLVYLFRHFVAPAVVASQERKNAELAEAERRRDEAKADAARAQRELDDAAQEVVAIGERAERDAAWERERLLAEAHEEGQRLLRNAGGELGRARYAARARLREQLIAKAVEVAQAAARRLDSETNAAVIGGVLHSIEHDGERR